MSAGNEGVIRKKEGAVKGIRSMTAGGCPGKREPKYACDNCGCTRHNPCGCMRKCK